MNLRPSFKLNIFYGMAGSGKMLILLYRLRLLYHLDPSKRFLVLTYNRSVSRDYDVILVDEAQFFAPL